MKSLWTYETIVQVHCLFFLLFRFFLFSFFVSVLGSSSARSSSGFFVLDFFAKGLGGLKTSSSDELSFVESFRHCDVDGLSNKRRRFTAVGPRSLLLDLEGKSNLGNQVLSWSALWLRFGSSQDAVDNEITH